MSNGFPQLNRKQQYRFNEGYVAPFYLQDKPMVKGPARYIIIYSMVALFKTKDRE
jgi:hypothetical protein